MPENITVLITGATSGLGREVARALAGRGAHVVLHGRDAGRVEAFADQLRTTAAMVSTHVADLASLRSVGALAEQVSTAHPELNVLINNAGVGGGPPPHRRRELSADGYELRLAVNYLAPLLLTRLLLPVLRRNPPASVVNVASVGQAPVDLDDLRMDRRYDGAQAYFRSKFALVAATFDLAEADENKGVRINCVHPANYMDTAQVREAGIAPWCPPSAGVDPVLNLAIGPGSTDTGKYYDGTHQAKAHRAAYKPGARRDLRQVTDSILAPFTA
ncbi:SDR family NAD(P)-dependent oxidoreductase [Actinoplanes sp. N902-109]|uniref:SDR family NAD(P)-dependent oxidoreductase n=1 Tax=Actinoplanes sp. (strain N902-109) TaxID=649831 RepID=UPI00032945D7|nr:SDR family NAD(P)-dependent oxidoreductase [Actinoplanes sp. N902-109]AGL13731.1 oxidoreductase [Actinoplanes sp. N902-109]